ncbi:hypothetical protein FQZ97_1047290 [compost metagenome]
MNREGVGARHVTGHELDALLLKARQEVDVTAEAIKLGDEKLRARFLGEGDGLHQFGPVGSFTRLDLFELTHDLP